MSAHPEVLTHRSTSYQILSRIPCMISPDTSTTTMSSPPSPGGSAKKRPPPSSSATAPDEPDPKVWEAISAKFREVQALLDQNRLLIAQVNENHQSKLPDNLANNVTLIREINGNIAKVTAIYDGMAVKFSDQFCRLGTAKKKK